MKFKKKVLYIIDLGFHTGGWDAVLCSPVEVHWLSSEISVNY
jgi:hypothetical protein